MATLFKHFPKGSVIGSGGYVFRHYGEEQTYPDYLCFTAEEAGSTVKMTANGSAPSVSLEYSTNRENWSTFTVGSTVITLANIGDKVYLRGDNTRFGSSSTNFNLFVMTGKIAASGNLMSIFDKTCESVAFTEARACSYMFSGCTSLTTAPNLPATTLGAYAYQEMFRGCTSLTTAPNLPATALATYAYREMFRGCSNLRYIKVGFNDWVTTARATESWMNGVSSSGTFVCPSTLPQTRGTSNIPDGWTIETF